MHSFRPCRTVGLWGACAALCLAAAPAQAAPPAPVTSALPPLQGAREALDHARRAKSLDELNGDLTRESAATAGFGLALADSMMSGMATTLTHAFTPKGTTPKEAGHEEASEKAFQGKVEALLKRYSLDQKMPKGADQSDTLPPSLIARGHQFLADVLVLSNAYEKSHASSQDGDTLGTQMGKNNFPAPDACTFHVLSPSHVQIVPRADPKDPIEARLEDGQWRLDLDAGPPSSSDERPKIKTMTPEAAALLKAINDGDEEAVSRDLKANPSLANNPPAFYHGTSGSFSNPPLLEAVFWDDPKIVALLLQYGANVGTEDGFGGNALDEAVQHDHKDLVALLLAHGANVRHKDGRGRTALHLAAESGYHDIAALLLAHGAAVNARDQDSRTPLAAALASHNSGSDHIATINLLRQHGAEK